MAVANTESPDFERYLKTEEFTIEELALLENSIIDYYCRTLNI